MKMFALTSLLGLAFAGCMMTDEVRTRRLLSQQGFTHLSITGYSWSCGRDDAYCTGFVATAPNGDRVTGAVGCGLGLVVSKGCTMRLD